MVWRISGNLTVFSIDVKRGGEREFEVLFFGRPGVIIYLLAVLIFRINFGSICINQWRTALSNLFELQRTFAKIHASLSNANTKKVPS